MGRVGHIDFWVETKGHAPVESFSLEAKLEGQGLTITKTQPLVRYRKLSLSREGNIKVVASKDTDWSEAIPFEEGMDSGPPEGLADLQIGLRVSYETEDSDSGR